MRSATDLVSQKRLNSIIDSELSSLAWNKKKFNTPLKYCALLAFKNLLKTYGLDMVKYLAHNSRSGGFQNKMFHEFIRLMELQIPFTCEKNGTKYIIKNISDPRLKIFYGEDTFVSIVTNGVIKNNTTKTYIGGRKATYIKPYYIGKLLSIKDSEGNNLLNSVQSYSFEKIIISDILNDTVVNVHHLMVVPHYQMGAMLYINRARQSIVQKLRKT